MNFRLKTAAWHSLGSAAVALVASWLVFALWYPSPLDSLAGGASLFLLLIAVDVGLGPLLTLVVANPKKSRAELVRDLGFIIAVQICALAYGMYTVAQARPAVLAFEVDIFRVVSANDIVKEQLGEIPGNLQNISWTGPVTLAAVKPTAADEQFDTIQLAVAGVPLSALPRYWRSYEEHHETAWMKAEPIDPARLDRAGLTNDVAKIAKRFGVPATDLRTLPVLARRGEGTILLAPPDARVVGILPVALSP